MISIQNIDSLQLSGEQLQLRKERKAKSIKGVLFGIGLASGAAIGFHVGANGFDASAPWPPAISLGTAILYLLAMLFGSISLSRLMDEEEQARTYKAVAFAGSVYLVVYPVWFLLWKGGFAIEPIHWALFVLFWASLAGATAFYRLR